MSLIYDSFFSAGMMKRLQDIPPETPQVPHEYLLVYSRRHGPMDMFQLDHLVK
jgi:hypothetical protein